MVHSDEQQVHIIGTGTIEDDRIDLDSSHVWLRVKTIASIASSVASVGQLVQWPKSNLAIAQPSLASDESTEEVNSKEQPESATYHDTETDDMMNYAFQVLQLGVFLMQLNDTEKEGDGERCLMNWKLLMLYFRSRQRGTKYAFEAMRLITCTKALFTEQTAQRVIHEQFVNPKGGVGDNYANDLKMETMVKDHKGVLNAFCGNKTLKAIQRATSASHGLKLILQSIDDESHIPLDSTHHTHASSTKLVEEMIKVLRKVDPFQNKPGRSLVSFPSIPKSPLCKLDVTAMHKWLTKNKKRLTQDALAISEDDTEEDEEEEEDDEEDTDSEQDDESDMV